MRLHIAACFVGVSALVTVSVAPPSDIRNRDAFIEDEIVRLTYDCRFDEAFRLTTYQDSADLHSIRRGFFQAMILWREYLYKGSVLIRDTSLENRFGNMMRSVLGEGEKELAVDPEDTTVLFFPGAGYGYLGELEASNGNYFK